MNKTFTDHFGNNCRGIHSAITGLNRVFNLLLNSRGGLTAKFILLLFTFNFIPEHRVMAQQTIAVRGVIVDNTDEETLIGVSITDAQRRSLGVTDLNGRFSINVPAGSTMTISSGLNIAAPDFRFYSRGQAL